MSYLSKKGSGIKNYHRNSKNSLKEVKVVETYSRDLPSMYGDHHVTEVRNLLMALPGVTDVYASSSFRIVEVQFDESALSPNEIEAKVAVSSAEAVM